jgi:NAD(P)-dependent dehydrogenase (short-subunit alcohol dehydrogenase family)
MSLFDLTGKVALVTGGTKGIGLGVVQQLAAHGAKVVISSRDQGLCETVAEEINRQYGQGAVVAKGVACDIDKLEDIERLAKAGVAAFGGLDILVCNAAVLPFIGPSAKTPPELFDRILTSNIHHNFRLCQAVRADMVKRGGGSIVLIGSVAGHTAAPETMAYSVAKAGLAHMARCLADEFVGDNIRVNCVSPGLIRSFSSKPLWENGAVLDAFTQSIPLRRIGEPEDIAGAVIFLSSQAGSYVTGSAIIVDGGRTHLSARTSAAGALVGAMSGDALN